MPTSAPPAPTGLDPGRDWPVYWFTRLESALHAGDFEAATGAARELRRLGVAVTYPRPMLGTSAAPAGSMAVARA